MNIEKTTLEQLVGTAKTNTFYNLINEINSLYDTEQAWNTGGKKWIYEYKFRKGSKTLCAFYFKENALGLMIIFGKNERAKVEGIRHELSPGVLATYDQTEAYHDGKWVMFNIANTSIAEDLIKLLSIKKRPDRK